MAGTLPLISRKDLNAVFKDPRTLLQFEAIQHQVATGLPVAVNTAQVTADNAQVDATDALALAHALENPSYVVAASSGVLNNELILAGDTGVSIAAVGPHIIITVNVPTALGYTPADQAGDTFTGNVKVLGTVECNTLRVDVAPTASVTASDHSIPININGVVYYMRLSTVP